MTISRLAPAYRPRAGPHLSRWSMDRRACTTVNRRSGPWVNTVGTTGTGTGISPAGTGTTGTSPTGTGTTGIRATGSGTTEMPAGTVTIIAGIAATATVISADLLVDSARERVSAGAVLRFLRGEAAAESPARSRVRAGLGEFARHRRRGRSHGRSRGEDAARLTDQVMRLGASVFR